MVKVTEGVTVAVGEEVAVSVAVGVAVNVYVGVAVDVAVYVGECVLVKVGVGVAVRVAVYVGVDVGVGSIISSAPMSHVPVRVCRSRSLEKAKLAFPDKSVPAFLAPVSEADKCKSRPARLTKVTVVEFFEFVPGASVAKSERL
jgi:hypothetical protein